MHFHIYNSFPREDIISLIEETAAVTELEDHPEFELYALGQVKSDGDFYYGLGFPMTAYEADHETYGGAVNLTVHDDTIYSGMPTTFDEVFEDSFTTINLLSLIEIVPNYYFHSQKEL